MLLKSGKKKKKKEKKKKKWDADDDDYDNNFMLYVSFNSISDTCTVDSHYLKVQGTPWNTSRYLYLDISDLQN